MNYILRNNEIEETWRIEYENKMFKQLILVQGTESEMRAYMESEFGYVGRYSACTDTELRAAKQLRIPIYLAPKDL